MDLTQSKSLRSLRSQWKISLTRFSKKESDRDDKELNKLVLLYLHFKEWLYLFKKGCLKSHDIDYIVTSYEGKSMIFEHCVRCKYTEGMIW